MVKLVKLEDCTTQDCQRKWFQTSNEFWKCNCSVKQSRPGELRLQSRLEFQKSRLEATLAPQFDSGAVGYAARRPFWL